MSRRDNETRIDDLVNVFLACGCRIRIRSKPMGPSSKYLCRSGLGHSYNQPWMSYEDRGLLFENGTVVG